MKIRRFLAAAVVTLLTGVAVQSAPSASAAPDPNNPWSALYSVPYGPALVRVYEPTQTLYRVGYLEWQKEGFPAPTAAPTAFEKYSWNPAIVATSQFGNLAYVEHLDHEAWEFSGFRAPTEVGRLPGTDVWRWASSPDELFAGFHLSPDVPAHRLTLLEWQAMGAPVPEDKGRRYFRLTWVPEQIAANATSSEIGSRVDYDSWAHQGYPTPDTLTIGPNDFICKSPTSDELRYFGAIFQGVLTMQQWAATGYAPYQPCDV